MKDKKTAVLIVMVVVFLLLSILVGIKFYNKNINDKQDENIEQKEPEKKPEKNDDTQDKKDNETNVVPTVNATLSTPKIELLGNATVYVEVSESFVDSFVKATDSKYGDLTSKVIVSGVVDTKTLGTYTLTYKVTNPDNRSAEITRTIIVRDTVAPVITVNGEAVMQEDGTYLAKVQASRTKKFEDYLTIKDNSGTYLLKTTYFKYNELTSLYEKMTDTNLELKKIGKYKVVYMATDETNNETKEITIVYVIRDTETPTILLDSNGTKGPMLKPFTTVKVEDNLDELKDLTIAYAWWNEDETGKTKPSDAAYQVLQANPLLTLNSEPNGKYYLWVKATDKSMNTKLLVSKSFEKQDDLIVNNSFDVNNSKDYIGIKASFSLNKLTDIKDIASITAKLYSGETLLMTNTSNEKLMEQALITGSINLTTEFVKEGTASSLYWDSVQNKKFTLNEVPSKVVYEVTFKNGVVDTLENKVLNEMKASWESLFINANIFVGTLTSGRGQYHNLNDAINAAKENDIIYVLNGTYDGEVHVTKDVTIKGQSEKGVILTTTKVLSLFDNIHPVVRIESNATLTDMTITSNVNSDDIDGIAIKKGSVNLKNLTIKDIKNNVGYNKTASGIAINVTGTSKLLADGCTVENFNTSGLHATGANADVTVTNTVFNGIGVKQNSNNQKGIVFENGSTGKVENSKFNNFKYYDYDSTNENSLYAICILLDKAGTVDINPTNNTYTNYDKIK